jgi:hypothetical protein
MGQQDDSNDGRGGNPLWDGTDGIIHSRRGGIKLVVEELLPPVAQGPAY